MSLKTYFAPAERDEKIDVLEDYEFLKKEKNFNDVLNSIPNIVLILNANRQIVFANQAYQELINGEAMEDLLGLRPGELLGCKNSIIEASGCGTAIKCKYCGAVQAILESQKTGKKITMETRIITGNEGDQKSTDIQITASHILINEKNFTVLTLIDISNEKRKEVLERVFFHDLLNKAGSLNCFFETLSTHTVGDKTGKLLEVASNLSAEIVEEINNHKSILEAEKGELKINKSRILSKVVIENVVKQISCHIVAYEKTILIHPETENIPVLSDYYLIIRVIMNMLKNALEATSREGKVVISCNKFKNYARFWVQNSRSMDEEVAQQIFQRSYSTKSKDRGLGTYSMKLLGENYLGGRVSFESSIEKGTIFYFDLPVSD
jgi:K+-sensing histidine kinase KdpD